MIAEQDEITRERIQTGRRVLRKESAMFKSCLRLPLVGAAGALAATMVALPSQAEECPDSTTCPTTVTFTVTAEDGLKVSVPDSKLIGDGAGGQQITAVLGPVTVTDERAALVATWVSSVDASAGGFTTGGGTPAETIPNTDVLYWSGTASATTGTGTFVPGQVNAAAAQSLNVSRTAYSKVTGSGDNSCTWTPWLVINLPAQAVAGTYTGTVNHSVA
ncbi:hypothetical protein [Nonomuraea sp. NPDC049141]|uniref:hypothetical protein n=1 Tax=Nonomuraea sp. NPDC049141 TaxID=3155500 RepID=UPI0033E2D109